MFTVIWAIVGGLILGLIARLLLKGRQDIPLWLLTIAGIAGMFVGDWLANLIGVGDTGGIDWTRHLLQVLVAIVAIAVVTPMWANMKRGAAH